MPVWYLCQTGRTPSTSDLEILHSIFYVRAVTFGCCAIVNTAMLVRVVFIYVILTVCAMAMHENSYAVFELREQLLRLTLNLWELLDQLQYASEPLRQRVYLDIVHIQSEIQGTIAELMRLDSIEHPGSK